MSCENLSDCPEALFEWTINDRPIRSLPQYQKIRTRASESYESRRALPSSKVKQKVELELSPTLGIHRLGRFACTSLFGGGASEFEPNYVPPSPIDLQVINISAETVNLSWKQPSTRHRDRKHGQVALSPLIGLAFIFESHQHFHFSNGFEEEVYKETDDIDHSVKQKSIL
uniref:Fibronectin type-III domain-containing protein n=1 Tax=Parascaris equorum TaxID=6256 RepID=A0A914R8H1_PAREQ